MFGLAHAVVAFSCFSAHTFSLMPSKQHPAQA